MSYSAILISAGVFLMAAGCGDSSVESSEAGTVIMPLQVGNSWEGTQTVYTARDTTTLPLTKLVAERLWVDREQWFVLSDIFGADTIKEVSVVTNRRGGLFRGTADRNLFTGESELHLKYPATAGETYTAQYGLSISVDATDTTIVVPTGVFECYRYTQWFPDAVDAPVIELYFAPGIGPVQTVEHSYATGRTVVWQLEAFVENRP